jgi:hypothetical protein
MEEESTSTTIKIGPPKYQTVINQNVRTALGIDDLDEGQTAILEANITLKRIIEEE